MSVEPERVNITPSVLTWAIEDGCVDRDKLCKRIRVRRPTLDRWEAGQAQPTMDEWRGLAEALRRPTAIFLLHVVPSKQQLNQYDAIQMRLEDAVNDLVSLAVSLAKDDEEHR